MSKIFLPLVVAGLFCIQSFSPVVAEEGPDDGSVNTKQGQKNNARRSTPTVTLAQAIEMAENYSWRSKAARAQVDVARARVDQAEAGYHPKVQARVQSPNGRYDHGYNYRDRDFDDLAQAGVELRYNLVDFGRTKYAAAEALESYKASDWARYGEDLTVVFETAKAYLDTQRYTAAVAAADAYVREIQRLNDTIREGVTGGVAPESESVRGRLALSNALNRKKAVDLQRIRAYHKLASLTGKEVQPIAYSGARGVRPKRELEQISAEAESGNPAVNARLSALESSRARIEAEKVSRLPRIDFVADYRNAIQGVPSNSGLSRWDGGVRLNLTVDLYDAARSPKIAEANANYNLAWAQLQQEKATVKDAIRGLKGDYTIAADQWTISREASKQAAQTKALYLEEFKLGQRSLSDMITAETEFFTSSVEALTAQYDYYQAVLSVYYISGQPKEGLTALGLLPKEPKEFKAEEKVGQ